METQGHSYIGNVPQFHARFSANSYSSHIGGIYFFASVWPELPPIASTVLFGISHSQQLIAIPPLTEASRLYTPKGSEPYQLVRPSSRSTNHCLGRAHDRPRGGISMKKLSVKGAWKYAPLVGLIVMVTALTASAQQTEFQNSWGTFVSPVFNTSEPCCSGAYSSAELFAGPNKFGSYFAGVLPNGVKVTPAGTVAQIGMNPLGAVLTPDGRYLITSNDDEREDTYTSFQSPINLGGYTLSVIDTNSFTVVSQINEVGKFFIGMQATGTGPYTLWVSGGGDNDVKLFSLSTSGVLTANGHIVIAPITPSTAGYVSNYTPDPYFNTVQGNGYKPPIPSGFNRTAGAQITFPAGSALSPDGHYLYVACNGDNSVAVIDTTVGQVVQQVAVGYFPYGVSVSNEGTTVLVSNWGVTAYQFNNPGYGQTGLLNSLPPIPNNDVYGFFVPVTNTTGSNPKTSSVSILSAPGGNGSQLTLLGSVYQGHPLDDRTLVGDTHPSATAIVRGQGRELVYVTKSNSDMLSILDLQGNQVANIELPLIPSPNAT